MKRNHSKKIAPEGRSHKQFYSQYVQDRKFFVDFCAFRDNSLIIFSYLQYRQPKNYLLKNLLIWKTT